jgi:magnesium-transporting ATPase (P-type)
LLCILVYKQILDLNTNHYRIIFVQNKHFYSLNGILIIYSYIHSRDFPRYSWKILKTLPHVYELLGPNSKIWVGLLILILCCIILPWYNKLYETVGKSLLCIVQNKHFYSLNGILIIYSYIHSRDFPTVSYSLLYHGRIIQHNISISNPTHFRPKKIPVFPVTLSTLE